MKLNNLLIGVLMGLMSVMTGWLPGFEPISAQAVTIYSYIDDQGNPRFTDAPDTIPEKYRAKVQTHEQAAPTVASPSKFESMKRAVVEAIQRFGITLPVMQLPRMQLGSMEFSGNNPLQSRILTYAGAAAFVLLIMMYLSRSPMVRLLAICLLVVLMVGTPVLVYVSDDGPADILKKKAVAAGQAQQDRLKPAGQ